mmetsp:Transcript_30463/g.50461  ORF Transcript_30463/g.50461 Transcript_30463/m.50461 type:complete len:358 (-) Transcript_30463:366-1439(-)|eukprot:CAMPEP_0119317184 /NCGR_PEP_ID=MMETSP1333-20130426/42259_1 /TAXON_ID=418940 /ORGANISM="Scyphosphaera apsteinii, Strain RCC1455" /LENGTH=357 /DNA_ID=CAMNT_0007323047 /DNA_START=163 /DNA_END=1236 /DNA_ORIENTATION=+
MLKETAAGLDSAGRLREAEARKATGNGHFTKTYFDAAMQSYLSAIWLLKIGGPPYPEVLARQVPAFGEAAFELLGDGGIAAEKSKQLQLRLQQEQAASRFASWQAAAAAAVLAAVASVAAAVTTFTLMASITLTATVALSARAMLCIRAKRFLPEPDALMSEAAAALRNTLHLNVAACALKREDWYLARMACQSVLAREPKQPKALYRLAQAYEGEGEIRSAIRAVTTLLKDEACKEDRAAHRLLAELKLQDAERVQMFSRLSGKGNFCAPAKGTAMPAPIMEKEDELTSRIRSLLEHEAVEEQKNAQMEKMALGEAEPDSAVQAKRTSEAKAEVQIEQEGECEPEVCITEGFEIAD